MPKKLNFLGGQQNYDADNGQYLPELKGPHGESPSGFKNFKKGDEPKESSFDEYNKKRMGKKKPVKKVEEEPKQEYNEYNEYEISEALADGEWTITDKTTVKDYANQIAKTLNADPQKVLEVIKSEKPDVITDDLKMADVLNMWEDDYGEKGEYKTSEYNKDIKVKADLLEKWQEEVGWDDDAEKIKKFVEKGNYSKEDLNQLGDYLEEYNYHKSAKIVRNWADTMGNKHNTGIANTGEWKLTPEIEKNLKANYKTQVEAESAVHDVYGGGWDDGSEEGHKKVKDYNAIMKSIADIYKEKPYQEYTSKFAQQQKEKSLNDYTDELFEKANVKTFTSKKYKNPQGEIVEIRRFGEGQNAIRYNETKNEIEQVWINGERVK